MKRRSPCRGPGSPAGVFNLIDRYQAAAYRLIEFALYIAPYGVRRLPRIDQPENASRDK